MSFAFLPLYTGDYLRDTRHLSPMRHGVYLLLLMHCWDQRGPLPIDEQECAGIANCRSQDDIEALRYVLARFFVRMEDGWYQGRMQKEIERAGNISVARSQAGKLGYLAKAKQLPSKSQASASTPTTTTTTTTTPTTTPKVKSVARGSRFADAELSTGWRAYCEAKAPNLDPEAVFQNFRDYWIAVAGAKGLKLDWDATWRTWVRREAVSAPTGRGAGASPENSGRKDPRCSERTGIDQRCAKHATIYPGNSIRGYCAEHDPANIRQPH